MKFPQIILAQACGKYNRIVLVLHFTKAEF